MPKRLVSYFRSDLPRVFCFVSSVAPGRVLTVTVVYP